MLFNIGDKVKVKATNHEGIIIGYTAAKGPHQDDLYFVSDCYGAFYPSELQDLNGYNYNTPFLTPGRMNQQYTPEQEESLYGLIYGNDYEDSGCVHEPALYESPLKSYNYCKKCNIKLSEV